DEARKAAIAEVKLPEVSAGGRATPRGDYMIGMRVTCETPLAHGADQKAGNATIFRRMQVLTDEGGVLLPYYSGNALRGQVRDLLADHFLRSLGLRADRDRKSTRLNSSHVKISYAVFCLKKKK